MTKTFLLKVSSLLILVGVPLLLATQTVNATPLDCSKGSAFNTCSSGTAHTYQCGGGKDGKGNDYPVVYTVINIGCTKQGNPITDMVFAIIRILSDGVGIVVIGSLIVGGIQYSASRGDPNASAKAMGRVSTSVGALLIYIFAYAILNYVIPKGFFNQ